MECRRVCHVNGAAGHCRLVEGIPLLQLGEDVNSPNASAAAMANQGHQAGTASALMGVLTFSLASIIGAALGFWQSASALPILTLMAICGVGGLLWHRLVLPKTAEN